MAQGDYKLGGHVAEDDPNRCQTVTSRGQCTQKAVEGSKYCPCHGGNSAITAKKAEDVFRYRATQWSGRMQALAEETNIKSMREELGVLRILLEERLKSCKSTTDLIINSGPMAELVLKIEKLVKSIHELDKDLNQLLDKQILIQYAEQIITIIGKHVDDEEARFAIAKEIAKVFNVPDEGGTQNESR